MKISVSVETLREDVECRNSGLRCRQAVRHRFLLPRTGHCGRPSHTLYRSIALPSGSFTLAKRDLHASSCFPPEPPSKAAKLDDLFAYCEALASYFLQTSDFSAVAILNAFPSEDQILSLSSLSLVTVCPHKKVHHRFPRSLFRRAGAKSPNHARHGQALIRV